MEGQKNDSCGYYCNCWQGVPRYIALFICAVLRQEKYRYSYGRKWVLESMRTTIIKLPEKDGRPDYSFMESYMKALPYGDRI